jgi:hypothetical protein
LIKEAEDELAITKAEAQAEENDETKSHESDHKVTPDTQQVYKAKE